MQSAKRILEKMAPNQKINYDRVLQKLIQSWQEEDQRPKILLHSCCAPCSTYTLEYLTKYADVDIYFANSNIHPEAEYQRRSLVQQEFIEKFNQDYKQAVHFIAAPYEPQKFIQEVQAQKLDQEPEGGARCQYCFDLRLGLVAKKAKDLGYDYFGSALTISPHKNSPLINEIGLDVEERLGVTYLPSDFKKNNGYRRSVELCQIYDIYRQCYCGCVFGAKAQGVDLKTVNKEAKAYVAEKAANIHWNLPQSAGKE